MQKRLRLALFALLAMLANGVAVAQAPYIDYDWEQAPEGQDICVYSAELVLTTLGYQVRSAASEVVGHKDNYKAVVACLPGTTLFIVAGPSYRQASRMNKEIKQAFNPPR